MRWLDGLSSDWTALPSRRAPLVLLHGPPVHIQDGPPILWTGSPSTRRPSLSGRPLHGLAVLRTRSARHLDGLPVHGQDGPPVLWTATPSTRRTSPSDRPLDGIAVQRRRSARQLDGQPVYWMDGSTMQSTTCTQIGRVSRPVRRPSCQLFDGSALCMDSCMETKSLQATMNIDTV